MVARSGRRAVLASPGKRRTTRERVTPRAPRGIRGTNGIGRASDFFRARSPGTDAYVRSPISRWIRAGCRLPRTYELGTIRSMYPRASAEQRPRAVHGARAVTDGLLFALLATAACATGCSSGDFVYAGSPDGAAAGSGGEAGTAGSQTGGAGGRSGSGGANGGTAGSGGHGTGGMVSTGGSATGGAAGGGAGSACRSDADCNGPGSFYCAPPGASVGCGICPSPGIFPSCSSDADCNPDGGTEICEAPCGGVCPNKTCAPGCVNDTPCAEGTHCGATHRCEALSCSSSAGCPLNFDCSDSHCQRRACQSDATCQGYCVTGYCYGQMGECTQPRA